MGQLVFVNGFMRTIPDVPLCRYCEKNPQPIPIKQPYCRACLNAHARATRPKHSKLAKEQRRRANARAYANVYVRRGKLKPQQCQVCGADKAQKHHDDYSKPLDVIWLCKKCHVDHHKKARRQPCTVTAPG